MSRSVDLKAGWRMTQIFTICTQNAFQTEAQAQNNSQNEKMHTNRIIIAYFIENKWRWKWKIIISEKKGNKNVCSKCFNCHMMIIINVILSKQKPRQNKLGVLWQKLTWSAEKLNNTREQRSMSELEKWNDTKK